MIYAHTSALIAVAAVGRPHADGLRLLLRSDPAGMVVVSALARREVATLPVAAAVRGRVGRMLADPRVLQVEDTALIAAIAADLTGDLGPDRNTHLATALSLRPAVAAFLCTDPALARAARSCGFRAGPPLFATP